MKNLIFVLLAASLLLSGCLGGGGDAGTTLSEDQLTNVTEEGLSLDDADIPFIEEDDTVEIGEML